MDAHEMSVLGLLLPLLLSSALDNPTCNPGPDGMCSIMSDNSEKGSRDASIGPRGYNVGQPFWDAAPGAHCAWTRACSRARMDVCVHAWIAQRRR